MSEVTEAAVLEALRRVQDPDLHRDVVSLGFVKDLKICGGQVGFTLELTTPACPVKEQLQEQARAAVAAVPGVENVNVRLGAAVRSSLPSGNAAGASIKNVIAVTSGKGGVGKSTCAVNLAAALAATGARVGLLDADVYGPNVPVMMGIHENPRAAGNGRILPLEAHGIKTISVGYMVEDGQPVMWRGPMLHRALEQFFQDVEWGEIDYLLVDMPPGTGDAQISLAQLVPLTGAVVVTMPQEVSLTDVRRAIGMCRQVKCEVLGVIENMSGEIFGTGGGEKTAEAFSVPFLGSIPLEPEVRRGGDAGVPVVVAAPDSPVARAFAEIAGKLAAAIATRKAYELPILEV
ncbi:MAG: iron-sulfur cluster carrier protein ApbC [Planctomycetota bacterium]|nr:MAG: iron-sulfur cluster carrier protein ApbC [Planctomycetota bacterium]